MCLDEPDKLIAIKKDNPLIIGVAEHGNFIASDVPAVLAHTNKVYYLNDKEIAILTKTGVEFYNMDREPIHKEPEIITWSLKSAEKRRLRALHAEGNNGAAKGSEGYNSICRG